MEGSARLKRFLFAFGFWLLVPAEFLGCRRVKGIRRWKRGRASLVWDEDGVENLWRGGQ